jgi:hypothetical protein
MQYLWKRKENLLWAWFENRRKEHLSWPRRKWEDSTKYDLKGITLEDVGWFYSSQSSEQWWLSLTAEFYGINGCEFLDWLLPLAFKDSEHV